MNKLYNTFEFTTSSLRNFFETNTTVLHKPQLKFLPEVIVASINNESLVTTDLAKKLAKYHPNILFDSIVKRTNRLFNNERFLGHQLFDEVIKYIISNMKLHHNDKRIHIIIDHMYSRENYTVLLASIRIGKQGIPIYFETFDGINNPHAFLDETIIRAVRQVYNIFKDYNYDLIFLADRWFNSQALLDYIDSINCTFCIRIKSNLKCLVFDDKEGHYLVKYTRDLPKYMYKSTIYNNVKLYSSDDKTIVNIAISPTKKSDDPWIIVTNGDPKRALKDYGYRFGGIETIFKNEKSNCFYLEDIVNAGMRYFDNLYAVLCIIVVLLTCIGTNYTTDSKKYKNAKITTHKMVKGIKIRFVSLFNTGLLLFNIAYESPKNVKLCFNFKLYDI